MSLGQFPENLSMDEVDLSAFNKPRRDFDLIVIGSGPAGQKAALTAAELGKNVAMVEREPLAGGVCLNTGTIPSKTLREAVLYLSGFRERGYYGEDYRLRDKITSSDLLQRTSLVIKLERDVINQALAFHGVTRLVGTGRLLGPNEVGVELMGHESIHTADNIILGVGTKPRRPTDVPFDDVNIFDSDAVFGRENNLRPLPASMIVLGAGVIGIEYASMFSALDIPTILVDPRPNPLAFADNEVSAVLYEQLSRHNVTLIFGQSYKGMKLRGKCDDFAALVEVELTDGRVVSADNLLFALGRIPMTDVVNAKGVGVELDKRGNIVVDENYRTSIPSIWAAGDVIGFPSLASTSSEQGRIAALNALGKDSTWHPDSIPYGIYTIPEVSMVGKTEWQLIEEQVPYVVGRALWRDTARGKIIGDMTGALKMLFHAETRRLLGVHIIGEGATELLHIGQSVLHFQGGLDFFLENVFNYPTLAEAYKIAAHNASSQIRGFPVPTQTLVEQVFEIGSVAEWAKSAM
jgi:NAD(P) transhydrogenase